MFPSFASSPLEVGFDSSIQHDRTPWTHPLLTTISLVTIPEIFFEAFGFWRNFDAPILPRQPCLYFAKLRHWASGANHVNCCWRNFRDLDFLEFHPKVFSGLAVFFLRGFSYIRLGRFFNISIEEYVTI